MRRTKCRVRDERKDPVEDRASRLISVNFFLIGNNRSVTQSRSRINGSRDNEQGAGAGSAAGRALNTRVGEEISDDTAERTDKGTVVSEDRSGTPGHSDPEPSTSRGFSKSVVKFSNRSSGTGSSVLNKKNTDMGQNQSVDKVAHVELDDESSACSAEFRPRARYILVGWDSFRSKLMLMLLILFVVWAVVYFPLLYLGY